MNENATSVTDEDYPERNQVYCSADPSRFTEEQWQKLKRIAAGFLQKWQEGKRSRETI